MITALSLPAVASQTMYGLGGPGSLAGLNAAARYPVRSLDGGKTWQPLYVFEEGTAQNVTGIAVDPANPATVYVSATVDRGGLWKSTDSGLTWKAATTGLPAGKAAVENLTVAGNDTQVLYVRIGNELYKTTDAAANWVKQGNLPAAGRLTLEPRTPTRGYLIVRGGAAYRSTDDGLTWERRGEIAVDGATDSDTVADCLTIDPSNGETAYACIRVDDFQGLHGIWGFWVSKDGGQSWRNMYETPQTPAAGDVLVDPTRPILHLAVKYNLLLYARSTDGGATFTDMGTAFSPLALDPRNADTVYGNAGNAVSHTAGVTSEATGAVFNPTFAKFAEPVQVRLAEGQSLTFTVPVTTAEPSFAVAFAGSASAAAWLSLPSGMGKTPSGIDVKVSAAGLLPGAYDGEVKLESPDSMGPGSIPIQLLVTPANTLPDYTITTFAGGGLGAEARDGVQALGARLLTSLGPVASDRNGNVYFATGKRVRKVDANGILTTVAGNGQTGDTGDGGPALSASFQAISGLAIDSQDRLYISDQTSDRVRVVENGMIRTLLSAQATQVNGRALDAPARLFVDASDNLYVVALGTVLRVLAGQNQAFVFVPQQGNIFFTDIAIAANGTIFLTDSTGNRVYRQGGGSALAPVAGTGVKGFSGDGVALNVQLSGPSAVELDANGNAYIIDSGNSRIRMLTPDGMLKTIAGGGGDSQASGIAGTDASIGVVFGDLTFDTQSRILFSDTSRLRRLTVNNLPRPRAVPGSFVNAGSNTASLSPGVLFSFYGVNLANGTDVAASVPWPKTLAGAAVVIDNEPVPLFFASPGQINGQIPYGLELDRTYTATVQVNGMATFPIRFKTSGASPGILVFGDNRAVVVNPDGSVNTAATPAPPGAVLVAYFTGTGLVAPAVPTGSAAPLDPLARPVLPVRIYVGELECKVYFAGLAPNFVGLGQANFEVPDLSPGDYPLTIVIGDVVSNGPVITVSAK